jgi:hypothetical protein
MDATGNYNTLDESGEPLLWAGLALGRAQGDDHQARSGDLPVAFVENEISVSFVPFATRFEIGVALHTNVSP